VRFRVLGSGSSGNATLIESGGTRILIDAGLGPRTLAERLEEAGVDPGSIERVLLSHEHADHAGGAAAFSARFGVRIAGTRGTYAAAGLGAATLPGYEVLRPGTLVRFGALEVEVFATPHDAAEPVGFVVAGAEGVLGHVTDLGHVNPALTRAFARCSALLIESNYDPGLLRDGPYPWSIKERILSPRGHLSNEDTARYLRTLPASCRTVVLAHLSKANNHPELAQMAAEEALSASGRPDVTVVLGGPRGAPWVDLDRRTGQLPLFPPKGPSGSA
jgi:phosphoribosyl 1,2-cyclic phosphodiesterase